MTGGQCFSLMNNSNIKERKYEMGNQDRPQKTESLEVDTQEAAPPEAISDEVYFSVNFNQYGQIVSVLPPKGKVLTIDKCKMGNRKGQCKLDGPIDKLGNITVICKPGSSPCCVLCGDELWCW